MGVNGRFTHPAPLGEGETLGGFCSGLDVVDSWARNHAPLARRRGTAVVYVSREAGTGKPAGFYSLSSHSVLRAEVAGGWLRRNAPEQVPTALLGMLGVDERFQGLGLGAALLSDAIGRCLDLAAQIGIKALVVDPADDRARGFYERYGFRQVPGTGRLYLPLGT